MEASAEAWSTWRHQVRIWVICSSCLLPLANIVRDAVVTETARSMSLCSHPHTLTAPTPTPCRANSINGNNKEYLQARSALRHWLPPTGCHSGCTIRVCSAIRPTRGRHFLPLRRDCCHYPRSMYFQVQQPTPDYLEWKLAYVMKRGCSAVTFHLCNAQLEDSPSCVKICRLLVQL